MDTKRAQKLKIAIAQLNPIMGDIAGNGALAREAHNKAVEEDADLIVFPELFITGYPPEDLVLKPAFVSAAMREVIQLADETANSNTAIIIGTPWHEGEAEKTSKISPDSSLYNAVAFLDEGGVKDLRFKVDLPNYGVFDEKRVFDIGPLPGPINFRGVRIGVPICEDIWSEEVCECLAETGAEFLIVPNGSPFHLGKQDIRLNISVARVTETDLPLIYVNQVGGQDELVFDGASFVINHDCRLVQQSPSFEETLGFVNLVEKDGQWSALESDKALVEEGDLSAYLACVLGLRDYVNKNGFHGVVLGLSGGIDSALCAAMAVDALGAEKVHGIMLPYHYTSEESLTDAALCAERLGLQYDIVPISDSVEATNAALMPLLKNTQADTTEENIQSRLRGTLLMALSNKFGTMLVTTGNKSEVSVGYATLYGDMNGGFNPIKDLYKTQVYRLSKLRNETLPKGCLGPGGEVIPENILLKAPTAELKENQKDQDSLPPYDQLDDILQCLVEKEMALSDIVGRGHSKEVVKKIEHLLYLAEYKRRQAAPGVKISRRNFGRDRRYPITNKFRETL